MRPASGVSPDNRWERRCHRQGLQPVAGVDEAGRGSLAGPVVAAAVVLAPRMRLPGLADSKLLPPGRREELYALILKRAEDVTWGWAGPREIDRINILQASFLAMRRALGRMRRPPCVVLVDGPHGIPEIECEQRPLVDGDARCRSIAAAGIVAKVIRDRLMERCHRIYPHFDFHHNRGYGTPEHLAALARHGACPLHRRSYAPVAMLRQTDFLAQSW
ncbi:MAG: ribonuclease HII [Candidatus Eisenbacteria bacterium]|nr:ribonuclease HII [Candidatus Eisenbacteria bacterium]